MRAVFSLIGVEFIAKLLSFAIIIIVAKFLGARELGYWSYTTAINAFLLIASSLGLDIYAMVEATKDRAKLPYILTNVITIRFVLFITIVVGLFASSFEAKVFWLLLIVFVGNFLLSLVPIWFFQVQEDFVSIAKIKLLQSAGYFFLALMLLFWLHSVFALAFGYLIVGLILVVWYGRRVFCYMRWEYLALAKWRSIIKSALFLGGALFLNQIYINTDKIMIAHILDKSFTGYYEAGYKLYFIVSVALGAVWTVYAPKVAKDKTLLSNFALMTLFVGLVYALFLWLFGKSLVFLLYGKTFLPTAQIMSYFAFSVVAITLSSIFSAPLPLFGKERVWFSISLGSVALNIVLNFWLIEAFGIQGAIIATIAAESFTALGAYLAVRKEL